MEKLKIKVHLGTFKETYKPKAENVKKLKIYLNKLENGK
jgi:hypothetical protein